MEDVEETIESIGSVVLANIGTNSAAACAIEAILMLIGGIKPEAIEPFQELIKQSSKMKWEELEPASKPAFQDATNRYLSILEMVKKH